jgi:hypothetical protein
LQLVGEAAGRRRWAAIQIIRNPAQPRQRAELNRGTEPVLHPDSRGEPAQVIAGQREIDDQVIFGDLVRPAAQPRELGVGQETNRLEAR